MTTTLLWIATTENRTTGPVPTAFVGDTRAATWDSCEGCALRGASAGRGRCYAWGGTALPSLERVQRTVAMGGDRTLEAALRRRRPDALVARVGAIGDPARAERGELLLALRRLRQEGLAVLSYTHFWREAGNEELRGDVMASCETPAQADQARALGWRPTVVLPADYGRKTFRLPSGGLGVVCPAKRGLARCNECRLCDPQAPAWKAGKLAAIGFPDHGPQARWEKRRLRLAGAL